jgi:mycofactocin precursor
MQPADTLPSETDADIGAKSDEANDDVVDEVLVEEISIDGMCGVY